MTESLWTALHTTECFTSFLCSSPGLFISLFCQQWAGLVRSGSPTISPRCALPSCCSALIKELLDEWLRCTESMGENSIFLTEAQSCISMTPYGQWKSLTHGARNIRHVIHGSAFVWTSTGTDSYSVVHVISIRWNRRSAQTFTSTPAKMNTLHVMCLCAATARQYTLPKTGPCSLFVLLWLLKPAPIHFTCSTEGWLGAFLALLLCVTVCGYTNTSISADWIQGDRADCWPEFGSWWIHTVMWKNNSASCTSVFQVYVDHFTLLHFSNPVLWIDICLLSGQQHLTVQYKVQPH